MITVPSIYFIQPPFTDLHDVVRNSHRIQCLSGFTPEQCTITAKRDASVSKFRQRRAWEAKDEVRGKVEGSTKQKTLVHSSLPNRICV
jgi:hypothetical protein